MGIIKWIYPISLALILTGTFIGFIMRKETDKIKKTVSQTLLGAAGGFLGGIIISSTMMYLLLRSEHKLNSPSFYSEFQAGVFIFTVVCIFTGALVGFGTNTMPRNK